MGLILVRVPLGVSLGCTCGFSFDGLGASWLIGFAATGLLAGAVALQSNHYGDTGSIELKDTTGVGPSPQGKPFNC